MEAQRSLSSLQVFISILTATCFKITDFLAQSSTPCMLVHSLAAAQVPSVPARPLVGAFQHQDTVSQIQRGWYPRLSASLRLGSLAPVTVWCDAEHPADTFTTLKLDTAGQNNAASYLQLSVRRIHKHKHEHKHTHTHCSTANLLIF